MTAKAAPSTQRGPLGRRPPSSSGPSSRPSITAPDRLSRPGGEKSAKTRVRLSYKEERELAALPEEIESLEREQAELTARMSQPDYHRLGGEQLRGDRRRLAELEELLLQSFARWEALEDLRARFQLLPRA